MENRVYVRFASHRAREYGLRALTRTPQAFYSLRRETGRGVYALTAEELATIRASVARARWATSITVLRGPYDDLHPCWES